MKKINRLINEYFSLESSLFRYSLSYCLLLALLPGIFIILILFQYSIIDVGSFLPAALHAPGLPRTGMVFSLSCVSWSQARVESCSKMLLPSKGEKRESHLVVPVADAHAASPLRSFSPAHFTAD